MEPEVEEVGEVVEVLKVEVLKVVVVERVAEVLEVLKVVERFSVVKKTGLCKLVAARLSIEANPGYLLCACVCPCPVAALSAQKNVDAESIIIPPTLLPTLPFFGFKK
jgi:hypothetical protein